MTNRWSQGEAYERYLGRWSVQIASMFVDWLDASASTSWLDVGCGTGALSRALLASDRRASLRTTGADPSAGFVRSARELISDGRAAFVVAPAEQLPFASAAFDVVVSGLVLNFLTDPVRGLQEMDRVCRTGGVVAAYVWDYTGEMWLLRHFWETVFELVPEARQLEEVQRFSRCAPEPLRELFTASGLADVAVDPLVTTAHFETFDDYWAPFLAGQGAAPSFVLSLPDPTRLRLGEMLRERLPTGGDGAIDLRVQAWSVRGSTG